MQLTIHTTQPVKQWGVGRDIRQRQTKGGFFFVAGMTTVIAEC